MSAFDNDYEKAMAATVAASPSIAVKLVKKTGGKHAVYQTEDNRVMVMRNEEYRNLRKTHHWKGTEVEYIAVLRALVKPGQTDPSENEIARGRTLAEVKANLARYLADEAAGTLGRRAQYGFHGSNRPVARL